MGVTHRIPIRVDIFERAFKRLHKRGKGATFSALAKKMKVPVAHLREWRHKGEVPADKLEVLAAALGTAPSLLVRTPTGEIPAIEAAASVYLPTKVGHNLLAVARTFSSYTRFLGYHRNHPQYPERQMVHHTGHDCFYASFFLEASAARQEWLFSVWFGLRMDYGLARLATHGDVELEPILQEQDQASVSGFAAENDDRRRVVTVRTWFGRPACDYVIQSKKPFGLRWTKEPVAIPGAVTFLKNPFQRDE